MTVWKYTLGYDVDFELEMPEDAHVLHVGTQYQGGPGEAPTMWVLVDPERPRERRRFRYAGTGTADVPNSDEGRYLGTCQLTGGTLVLHVFELTV